MPCSRSASCTSSTSPGLSSARKMRIGLVIGSHWERHEKCRADSRLRLGPHAPAIPLDNMLANREPQTRSGILVVTMQALEQSKNAFCLVLLKPDTVVLHANDPVTVASFGSDVYARDLFPLAVFQRV